MTIKHKIQSGRPMPLGATLTPSGANFAVCSRHATAITLELFSAPEEEEPTNSYRLDPRTNKSGDIWHIFVSDVSHGQLYGFRVDGPYAPREGHRFNRNKLLMDPYTKAIAGHYTTGHTALFGHKKNSSGKLIFTKCYPKHPRRSQAISFVA